MDEDVQTEKKSGAIPILAAVSIASILASAAFVLTYSGLVMGKNSESEIEKTAEITEPAEPLPTLEFLPLEPLLISLGSAAPGQQLRFEGYLEINPAYQEEVVALMPRIMDVLNTYLRAIEYSDIEAPASLLRIRLQMLKRVQIVVGDGRVNDLLVSKFLIS